MRVAHSNTSAAFFDDPQSALDTGVSRQVFDRLLKGSSDSCDDALPSSDVSLVARASGNRG